MASPDQYKRPDPYQVQLQKQTNAALEATRKKKEAEEKAKKLKELEFLKKEEARNKAYKLDAEKKYAVADKNYRDLKVAVLSPSSDGGATITPAEQTAVNYLGKLAADQKAEVTTYTAAYKQSYTSRISLEKDLVPPVVVEQKKTLDKAKVAKRTTKSTSLGNTIFTQPMTIAGAYGAAGVPTPPKYFYNAPLINYAYLSGGAGPNDPSPQQGTSNLTVSGSANYNQGLDAWTDSIGSKGVIQMDVTSAFSLANASTTDYSSYDGNLYGFKFLYNPKEVSMTWGVAEGMNWEGIAAGLDPGTSPTSALQNSTISFSLLLNRTLDIGFLDSNGLKQGVKKDPYGTFSYDTKKGRNKELAEIYEKGTMYDLEYLFKTLSGLNSTFDSGFNFKTSDQGWLQGFAVELHLGNKMRYLVRVSSVDVTHSIFDERMVPILSYVNLTCARFPYIKQS